MDTESYTQSRCPRSKLGIQEDFKVIGVYHFGFSKMFEQAGFVKVSELEGPL